MFTSALPPIVSSRLVIDCSHLFEREDHAADVSRLVRWVTDVPRRESIHVYLGSGKNRRESRKLQSRLQALGCRVVARHVLPAA